MKKLTCVPSAMNEKRHTSKHIIVEKNPQKPEAKLEDVREKTNPKLIT